MEKDIFGQEGKILAAAKQTMEEGEASHEDYSSLVNQYGKLLRTTKRIIKLSDKNEQRLNELKQEAQETNTQLEGMSSQLSKFLSPQLYNSIFSGSRAGTRVTRRKKLTVFFSDLCGFTNFVESMESEDVTSLLNLYLETMTELDNLADQWVNYGMREPLQMRIGIDTGFATVGNFGSESRLDYTAIGSAVNRASRLESAADHGSIFISEDTYNLVRESIEAVELEPIHLKGIGEFKARKVLGTIDSQTISVDFGKRNFSLVLDRMSQDELTATKSSLQKAIRELEDYQQGS